MDDIGQQHDVLQHELEHRSNKAENHPMFTQISEWEQESIIKIQVAVEAARADLQQVLEASNDRLKSEFAQLSHRIRAGCASNYSETNLSEWTIELNKMRDKLAKACTNLKIAYDHEIATVHFISIVDNNVYNDTLEDMYTTVRQPKMNVTSSTLLPERLIDDRFNGVMEQFKTVAGDAELTENNLVAKKSSIYSTSIRGTNLYTTGTHQRRFRVEHLSNNSIFIGIISTAEQITTTAFKLPSVYGWWDANFPVVGGTPISNGVYSMRTGDEVIVTLVCDERKLLYQNTRYGSSKISVNLDRCPFPWQLLVVLGAGENILRILS